MRILHVATLFSPDGAYVIFAKNDPALGTSTWDLFVVPADGRRPVPYEGDGLAGQRSDRKVPPVAGDRIESRPPGPGVG